MIESIDGNGAPPQELTIAWQCKNWNTLPENGAYFEQDFRLITTMTTLMNYHNVLTKYRSMVGEQIHQLTLTERVLLRSLIDAGVWYG